MRTDTTRMSSEVPPADGRAPEAECGRTNVHGEWHRCRVAGCARHVSRALPLRLRISSATRTTCAISRHRVHADDVRAGQHRGGDRRGRAPVAFGGRPVAERVAHERLPRRSDEHRPIRAPPPIRQAAPAHHNCAPAVWQTRPRDRRSRGRAARRRRAPRATLALSSAMHFRHDIVVDRLGVHRLRPAARVHQHQAGAACRRRRAPAPGRTAGR